jgi:hypothetical protein
MGCEDENVRDYEYLTGGYEAQYMEVLEFVVNGISFVVFRTSVKM